MSEKISICKKCGKYQDVCVCPKDQPPLAPVRCSTAPEDLRNPLAKARDEWLASKEGKTCLDSSILRSPSQLQFLENRLVMAFLAGLGTTNNRKMNNQTETNGGAQEAKADCLQRGVMPHARTIQRRLKELRRQIDSSKDPAVQRISYAMETAIRWAREKTVGWEPPAETARDLAIILRRELNEA